MNFTKIRNQQIIDNQIVKLVPSPNAKIIIKETGPLNVVK